MYLKNPVVLTFTFLVTVACISCGTQEAHFSKIESADVENYNEEFVKYCKMDPSQDFEQNAVLSSFFGDHKNSIIFASKAVATKQHVSSLEKNVANASLIKDHFEEMLKDPKIKDEDKSQIRDLLNLMNRPKDLKQIFNENNKRIAKDYIIEKSQDFHFLLINEGHYSSQNRAFTKELLRPLWENGFRYLALEALGYADTLLNERGYPLLSTGYYTKETAFGNMIRDALAIGYKLIIYETTGDDGKQREVDQAENIYKNTWKKDTIGKVLVHAGYGHIQEGGDMMGYQLKRLAEQDILTVEQENYTEQLEGSKLNNRYNFVRDNIEFNEPIVFVDTMDNSITFSLGVDIQVFHPTTTYIKGRPDWLISNSFQLYDLPEQFDDYKGHLLQAFKKGEEPSAVPIDQFVVDYEKAVALPSGTYDLKLIDCEGTLKGTAELEIK